MNKKIKMLEVDIDENNEKVYVVDKEINRIQKVIRRKKHKNVNIEKFFPELMS